MPDSSTTATTDKCGGASEGGRRPDPSDQHAAERRAARERHGARQFDPRIGRRQLLRSHQRRHQRRRGDAVGHGAAHRDEAEQRQQRQRHQAKPDQQQRGAERRGAQRFRARHQVASRDPVGQQPRRDREQDEGQRQRGLQQPGLAFADAEQQHGYDRRRGQRDLLGRLGGQVGPGQAVEGRGRRVASAADMAVIPWTFDWPPLSGFRSAKPTRFPTMGGTADAGGVFLSGQPGKWWLDAVANELQ